MEKPSDTGSFRPPYSGAFGPWFNFLENAETVTPPFTCGLKQVVLVDSAGTVTLPPANNAELGYYIKNISTGAVTLAASGTNTIDGAASYALTDQYDSIHVISNGSNWYTLAAYPSSGTTGADGTSGAWELLSTTSITAVASIDLTWDETLYNRVKFIVNDMQADTDSVSVYMRVGSAGGTVIHTANYAGVYNGLTGSWPDMVGGGGQFALNPSTLGNAAGEYLKSTIVLENSDSANLCCSFEAQTIWHNTIGGQNYAKTLAHCIDANVAIDLVRFFPESGSFRAGGTIKLYGLNSV